MPLSAFTVPLLPRSHCQNNGRPSIDPEVFFRLILIGYLYNIHSDRQLCEEVQYNLAYRWFCHLNLEDKVPNHSSLTTIRDRLGLKIFQKFFEEILYQCQKQGLVKAQHIMTDCTLIHANASLNTMALKVPKEPNPNQNTDHPLKLGTYPKRHLSNDTHYSRTDPDATLAKKKGTPAGLKYKAHLSIDADNRIVVDTHITTGAVHESQVYIAHLDFIQHLLNCFIQIAIADRGYGSGKILQTLIERYITPIIPLFNDRTGNLVVTEEEGFHYDAKQDRYRCPAGKELVPYKMYRESVKYHSQNKVCKTCTDRLSCPAKHVKHSHVRFVCRNIYQPVYEHILQQMKTDNFIAQQNERFWKMEGMISEAKHRHCLARAKYRGLIKMQIQAYLSATAQNIKRLITFFMFFLYACKQYIILKKNEASNITFNASLKLL